MGEECIGEGESRGGGFEGRAWRRGERGNFSHDVK